MKGRVFLIERPRHLDASKAESFGEIVLIFGPHDRRVSVFDKRFESQIVKRLIDLEFDPTMDYFCVVGGNVPIVHAIAALVAQYGEVAILVFNAQGDGEYVMKRVGDIDDVE